MARIPRENCWRGSTLPTRDTLNRLNDGADYHYVGFSARTQTEALYNLAEAQQTGEGDRFLAKLHRRLGPTSAIVALDPGLQTISRQFTVEELARDLAFADPRALSSADLMKPLPANIRDAVDLLCRVMAPDDFGTVVELIARNFRLQRGDTPAREIINGAIMQSRSRRDALGLMIRSHGPPPSTEEATRGMLMDAAERSAALALDDGFGRTLRALGDEPLPDILQEYSRISNTLPSRMAQIDAAPRGAAVAGRLSARAAQQITRNIITRRGVEELPRTGGNFGGPSYIDARRAHAGYSQRVHASGVPRSYSRALRSSRAARGIAVGGPIAGGPGERLEGAFWVPSRGEPEFGRVVVKMAGRERAAATRHLFADSFEAAVSLLWDDHGEEAAFRDGEITILLSMDPESSVGMLERTAVMAEAERRLQELARAAEDPRNLGAVLELYREAAEVQGRAAEGLLNIPRGIVVHPALHGRELAWSAARIDFWFNDLDQVSVEGAMINGGATMPTGVREAMTEVAGTWQFYERASMVALSGAGGLADVLGVRSRALGVREDYSAEVHFAVSLFAFGENRPSPGAVRDDQEEVWRLVEEERAVQPLLDWAFTNHHDFIRLNDFAEALSVLRWIDGAGQQLVILDPNGPARSIATPDRIVIGQVGPRAGEGR